MTPPPAVSTSRSRPARTILVAGLVAGVLDIGYVFVYFNKVDPFAILRGIAAGLWGRDGVKDGGVGLALLGLALHFIIALGAAAAFYAASRKAAFLTRYAVITGPLYGVAVWLVMNLVVLPLSANPPKAFPAPNWIPVFVAHLICVGLPIALVTRFMAPPPRAGQADASVGA